jgi:hypothetical protein
MKRFLISLVAGLFLGLALGFFLGWSVFPVEYTNGPVTALRPTYIQDYTVMVAEAYMVDRDITGAFERLRVLQVENVPLHVQNITEQYITDSRSVGEIQALVALSEALGRLTPIMEPYRQVSVSGNAS